MMRNTLVSALGLGVLVFIFSILQPTAVPAFCSPPRDCVCTYDKCTYKKNTKGWCEQKGSNYRWEAGSCIKVISKAKPTTSGGVGGAGPQEACESKGANYRYDPQTGGCIKSIIKPQPSTHAYGGGGGGSSK